jgi:hypothetical protein
MIRRTIGTAAVAALLLVPFGKPAVAAPSEDKVKCVITALVNGTGVYWCFATTPPPP